MTDREMREMGEIDCRCETCIDMGVECPQGYRTRECECAICEHEWVVVGPGCAVEESECPECGYFGVNEA